MQARSNRTFICSVVFLDIVEYTKKPVAEQIQQKERLNALLAEALQDVAANDRIILDTGDGAAISFVGDPEDALFVCLALRDEVSVPQAGAALKMRIGINLGPVKLIRDLNGQPNIIGDGINVAQRVMSFADPNQVLVSRSYYEVVSCMSEAYGRLFRYEGSRTDKHVREHEVYAVGESSGEIKRQIESAHAIAAAARNRPGMTQTVINRLSASASLVKENLRARPRLGTAMAVVAILVIAAGLRGMREQPGAEKRAPAESASKEKIAAAPARVEPLPAPPQEKAAASAKKTPVVDAVPGKPAAKAAPARPPVISFSILPWGEIYIDGKKHGVSPPLREMEVKPGRHTIEIRNADFTPYSQTVDVKPGSRIRIRHRFR